MPFGDKSIDVVIITNPDTDHMGGVVDILQNYKVDMILESGTHSDTVTYRTLSQLIAQNKIQKKFARKGMRLVLDNKQNIYFDILFPDRDVSTWERNDGSVVGKLVYGTSSFMLMGDATKYTELLIAYNENPQTLHSQVLKLGHHGSHTSSSLLWLEKVKPEIAIVSAGLNNRYGHPHKDVIQRLSDLGIAVFGTYEKGEIMFKTNGVKLWQ
ncbi:MBL fold metallo-hydrolase [Candidatus Nomurabacteria bacterium]|nr:MBL fold metallo-hydrolase [Candidatus Nomurabacteria bacterium]